MEKHSQTQISRCSFITIVGFWLLFSIVINSQEQKEMETQFPVAFSGLTISDFAYPIVWWSSEQHANFKFSHRVNKNIFLEWQGEYDTYLIADVFKTPLLTKIYITDRLYLYTGIELEMERDKLQIDLPPPQFKFKNGWGYDIKSNFSLEVEHDLHFNKSVYGAYGTPSLLSLHGKFKF